MRIVPVAPVPARSTAIPAGGGRASPVAIVCGALLLALVFLTFRIAGVLGSPAFPDCSFIADSVEGSCPIPEIRASHPLS
jgi:hypothetical protein